MLLSLPLCGLRAHWRAPRAGGLLDAYDEYVNLH